MSILKTLNLLIILTLHIFVIKAGSAFQYQDPIIGSRLATKDDLDALPDLLRSQYIESSNSEHQGQSNKPDQSKEQHHTIPGVGLSIVFIFGSLLYGSLLKLFSRITSIPYNPLLLLSGIILGIYHGNLGIIGQATHLMSKVDPNAILSIFLPCLIFQSGFKTEWHIFKKLAGQSLIIGVLSSLVGASLIMLIIKLLINSDTYSWNQALLLGSLLTCTDILSFVVKLKRGGTPQKITSLIEGQSLFNYCTCVMIFQFIQYQKQTVEVIEHWDYFSLFLEYVLGGIAFGVVAGVIAVYCIKRMIYDGPLVVTLIVIFTYSIYLTAEYSSFRISGIISLTVFSLYMNAFGKTWLFGQTQQYTSSFWNYLVFVAQTSIFMIAGVLVGVNVNFQYSEISIQEELLITLYIYLAALLSRFLSIGVFIKYLRRLGQGMTWSEILVLTFAGLKGAIGIALAMHVYKNNSYDKIVASLILLHVTTNSLITLFLHGVGTNLIVKLLGISSLKRVQYKFFKEYLYSFEASILEQKNRLKHQLEHGYEMIDWTQIEEQIGLPQLQKLVAKTEHIIKNKQYRQDNKFEKSQLYKLQKTLEDYNSNKEKAAVHNQNDKFDLEVEYRKRFLKNLIAKYWQFHDNNFTTPAALMLLIQSANSDLDKQTEQIESWNWIRGQISFMIKIYSQLMKLTIINQLAKSYLFEYVSFCYDVVSSYIKANEQVRQDLQSFYNTSDYKDRQEEINILRNIMKESQENQKEAQYFLVNYLEPSFPEIQKEVKTRKVSFFVLHSFKDIIDKNNENGQLEPNQYDLLNQIIDTKSLQLNLSSPKWQQPNLYLILKDNQLFKLIPQPILRLICEEIGEVYPFDANERIVDSSEIAKYFFIIKKGGCIVQFTNQNIVYKQSMLAGQVFGFQSLLTNIYHSKTTSNTLAEIVQIKKSLMLKIFDTFPQFEEQFWKSHIFQCYKMFVKKDDITFRIGHFLKEEVIEMTENFKLERFEPIQIENTTKDLIFIRGYVQITEKQEASVVKSQRPSLNTNNPQFADPFTFISRLEEAVIKVKEPSYFLVGQLDYELFERLSVRTSRAGGKSLKKMKSIT